MANRSEYPATSMSLEEVAVLAVFQGAAAAVPVIPATGATTAATATAADNFGTATGSSRAGVGTYTLAFKEKWPCFLDIIPNVIGTDGKWAQTMSWSTSAGTVTVQVYNAAGAAADLAATDFLRLTIKARKALA